MQKITLRLQILFSHNIEHLNYQGCNEIKIISDDDDNNQDYITVSQDFNDEVTENEIKTYFQKLCQNASIVLALKEANPHYGCPYFKVVFDSYKREYIPSHNENKINLGFEEFVSSVTTQRIQKKEILDFLKMQGNDFCVESFYNGLKANSSKTKFFSFFVIIEYIENQDFFKKQYDSDKLFSSEDSKLINEMIKSFDDRKKSVVRSILNRTQLSRAEKLYKYFESINLSYIQSKRITYEDIKCIIDQRNSLFHSSSTLNENILYSILFPLVSEYIKTTFRAV